MGSGQMAREARPSEAGALPPHPHPPCLTPHTRLELAGQFPDHLIQVGALDVGDDDCVLGDVVARDAEGTWSQKLPRTLRQGGGRSPHSALNPGSHLLARVARWGKARGTTGRRRSTSVMVAISKGNCVRFLYRIWELGALGPNLRSNSSCSRCWI